MLQLSTPRILAAGIHSTSLPREMAGEMVGTVRLARRKSGPEIFAGLLTSGRIGVGKMLDYCSIGDYLRLALVVRTSRIVGREVCENSPSNARIHDRLVIRRIAARRSTGTHVQQQHESKNRASSSYRRHDDFMTDFMGVGHVRMSVSLPFFHGLHHQAATALPLRDLDGLAEPSAPGFSGLGPANLLTTDPENHSSRVLRRTLR
jgi:hypothetical protein